MLKAGKSCAIIVMALLALAALPGGPDLTSTAHARASGNWTAAERSRDWRNAGGGALIGGGAGLVQSNSRWATYDNRYDRICNRW